jgi:predicted amidohydrolase YtcJ
VTGGSFDLALTADGRFDARWLDAAVPDRPVYLESADHHCAWVNSAAMTIAGIDRATPDPPAGTVARRPDGSPMGTLVEWTAMDLVKRHLPRPTRQDKRAGIAAATGLLAAAGVTWAQEAALSPADVPVYLATAAAGELAVRVNIALRAEPREWRTQLTEFAAARALTVGYADVSAQTVKIFADGVVEAGTAAMLEPYADAPDSTGLPVWSAPELAEAMTAFDAAGFQCHVHAIGDAAIRRTLDAVEVVRAANGERDRRPVVAHVQVVDPQDLPRFARLGVVANLEPLWACLDDVMARLTAPRLGPVRTALQYPMASLLASGAHVSMGSDWPISSLRPLDGLAVAVTRQTAAGAPPGGWLPHERLTPEQALAAYTGGSAYQAFDDHRSGRIRAGGRADLVWLAADPVVTPPAAWSAIEVRGTWCDGRRTHGS